MKRDRVLGHQIRDVALLGGGLVAVKPVPFSESLLREVVDRGVVTDELREASPQRVVLPADVPQVPLAEDGPVLVARPRQHFRKRDLRSVQPEVLPG